MDYDHNKHVFYFFLVFIILNFIESKSRILINFARHVGKLFSIFREVIPIVLY